MCSVTSAARTPSWSLRFSTSTKSYNIVKLGTPVLHTPEFQNCEAACKIQESFSSWINFVSCSLVSSFREFRWHNLWQLDVYLHRSFSLLENSRFFFILFLTEEKPLKSWECIVIFLVQKMYCFFGCSEEYIFKI